MKPKIKFRSITDLMDFNDDTVNHEPSMVDASQYEPLESLVNRLLAGEYFGGNTGVYDAEGNTVDEAFENAPITACDGFDLADAARSMALAEKALKVTPAPGIDVQLPGKPPEKAEEKK